MGGIVGLVCLLVLCHFNGVLCYENKEVSRDFENNLRTKRCPESENQNLKHNIEKTLSSKTIETKDNNLPESVTKIELPINEKNEPKDVRDVNNILIDIATIAHNKNNTIEIEKIRHLVDEIAKRNEMKHNVEANGIKSSKEEPSVTNVKTVLRYIEPINDIETKEMVNIVSLKKPTKHSENDHLVTKNAKIVLKHVEPINDIEIKETVNNVSLTKHTKNEQLVTENATKVSPINDIETKEMVNIVSPTKPKKPMKNEQLVTRNAKIVLKLVEPRNKTTKKETVLNIIIKKPITGDHKDIKGTKEIKPQVPLFTNTRRHDGDISDDGGDRVRTTPKDKNLIKIKEHMDEEELLQHTNTPENAYNWYNGPTYNHNYGNRYVYTGNEDYDDNYYINGDNYPLSQLGNYNSNQQTSEVNNDCARYIKTIIDRDTIVSVKPNEQRVKSFNEDRKEITNIQSPDFYRKYYSDMQKQYLGDNGVV